MQSNVAWLWDSGLELLTGKLGLTFSQPPAFSNRIASTGADTVMRKTSDIVRSGLAEIAMPGEHRISVAIIDGPYDAAALSGVLADAPLDLADGHCGAHPDSACEHGTFIVGLLGARHDALLPGLCPGCRLMHLPLFAKGDASSAGVDALATAIAQAVSAGASLINLSLAILGDENHFNSRLAAALDFAATRGALLLVAAGNQGRPASGQLLAHPAAIPVVAVDAAQRLLPDSNFGPSVSRRGVAALGRMPGYAAGGGTTVMSGTSVAAAVATGILAQVWSERRDIDAAALRSAVAALGPRSGSKPPVLDRDLVMSALHRATSAGEVLMDDTDLQGATTMTTGNQRPAPTAASPLLRPPQTVRLAGAGCGCGAPDGTCTCGDHAPPSGFVYAIGTIEADYPNIAIEREMQALADDFGLASVPGEGALRGLTEDPKWQYEVLSKNPRLTRYLARQLRWRLTIEDFPVFVLEPADPSYFDDLVAALKPAEEAASVEVRKGKRAAKEAPAGAARMESGDDLDVVVGIVGPQTPEGILVRVDQIFQVEIKQMDPTGVQYYSQFADSHGLTDEDRAYNYLMARYKPPPGHLTDPDYKFVGMRMAPSRLGAGHGRIMRAIYTFRTKEAGTKEFFVRVDVTHEFPMIVSPWLPYLERGENL